MAVLEKGFKRKLDKQFATIRQMPIPIIQNDRYKYTIKDVNENGYICFEGKNYMIEKVGHYEEGKGQKKWVWYELKLFCLETGELHHIEWEEDDEIEVSITTASLKFSDLYDDERKNIDEDDLDQIVEDDEDIVCNNKVYAYGDDYKTRYYPGKERKNGENVYFYDFLAKDKECLTIEEWGSDKDGWEYQIFLSREINHDSIEILSLGDANG